MTLPEENLAGSAARRRFVPLAWAGSAAAAVVLALGVTGTLSSWTQAIITNDTNTVDSIGAVSLKEMDATGTTTCVDTADTVDNTATCTDINKYGGTGTPLNPDNDPAGSNTQTESVQLENTGTVTGALTIEAGECTATAATGSTGADPDNYSLCDEMEVKVECGAFVAGLPPVALTTVFAQDTLTEFAGAGPLTAAAAMLADGKQLCTFTLTLPSDTPAGFASQVASQMLTWDLSAI